MTFRGKEKLFAIAKSQLARNANESERYRQGPQAFGHQWRRHARLCSFIALGRVPRPCTLYYLDKQSTCEGRGEVNLATVLGEGDGVQGCLNISGSCHIDSSLDFSFLLPCLACRFLALLAAWTSAYLRLLRLSTAHVSPPNLALSFTIRKQFSTKRCPQDVSSSSYLLGCLTKPKPLISPASPPHSGIHMAPPAASINSCLDSLDPNTKHHMSTSAAVILTPSVIAIAKAHKRSDLTLSEPKLRHVNCAVEDIPLLYRETN
jgi:hypothetical protein